MEKGKKHPEMKTREKLLTAQQKETMGNCPNNVQFRKKKSVPSSQASSPSTLRRCHHPPCPTRIVEQLPSHARISPGDLQVVNLSASFPKSMS